ncbi:hypothetical protein [Citrobacter portucalensis]|uniref:hypothetical protein n=1 Tax=Citrobacter portucalensis TaxID=1639133 RepID=UPI0018A59078|nr:hypothetical protein [Citrobacter portucalensis]BBV41350.1 hypothetical protein STW0522CIT26_28220 [Citrobacter portucalensis]BBV46331.1 hypothetical protein STW0522CIT27_27710 [Citrobacter portucalensis]BBV51613.1 hypothetical protein STW0522CIT30_28730 [Citrobacter portucalensis]BBW12345.1 hypothetical protein STN0717CIT27_28210 [Citrobacter portucalensis]BBW17397.1 hypothetical protein STN0717CIT36_28210 [Citrobacter portucalensis]
MSNKVKDAKIEEYFTVLKEKSRPPSKGGNTKALHAHYIKIDGMLYSFLAFGSKQWIFKTDRVSFEFEMNGEYRNILRESIITIDSNGEVVIRGLRGFSKKLRTADTRLPASRRECRD